MINFYHRFLPKVAATLLPLHRCVVECGNSKLIKPELWSPECAEAFSAAKKALSSAALLRHPSSRAPTRITVDASQVAVGASLEQQHRHSWHPIAFYSKKLSETERKYSAFDRELLAVFRAIAHFRHYVEGHPFHVLTDHKPLCRALKSSTDRSPRQTRHLAFISEFTADIRHIRGAENFTADTLSRIGSTDAVSLLPLTPRCWHENN